MLEQESRRSTMNDRRVLLVYEEIPERTVILYLSGEDLKAAKLSYEEIASIHGTYQNSSDLTEKQEAIHDKVNAAIFGPWNEEKGDSDPAVWQECRLFRSGDKNLNVEGKPPTIYPKIDLGAIVIHCGFAL